MNISLNIKRIFTEFNFKLIITLAFLVSLILFINSDIYNSIFYIIIIIILLLSRNNSFAIIAFLVPFYGILKLPGLERVSIPFLLLIVIIKLFFTAKRVNNYKTLDKVFLLIFVSIILNFLVEIIFQNEILNIIDEILFIILLLLTRRFISLSKNNLINILIFYIIGTIVSGFFGIIFDRFIDVWSFYSRYYGCVEDPNYFGRALLFSLGYILYLLNISKNENLIRNILLLLLICILFLIVKTFSIMALLTSVFLIVIFIISNFKEKKSQVLFFMTALIIVGYIIYDFDQLDTLKNIILPKIETMQSDINYSTTGRFQLQLSAIKAWESGELKTLIFGTGIGSSKNIMSSYLVHANVIHSLYFQTLLEQGIVGILVLFILVYFLLKFSLNQKFISPLIVFLVTAFALSGMYYWDQFIFFVIAGHSFLRGKETK